MGNWPSYLPSRTAQRFASTKDTFVVAALADEMRRRRIIITGIAVIERTAGQAYTEAEEALIADVAGG
ncbi:hypothetical protein LJR244_004272 [Brucella pseudogrignonensis]